MKINEKIKQARKAAGLTQKQVAEKLGVTKQSYAFYEYGTRRPRLNKLKQIAEVCGVGLDYFGNIDDLQKETGFDLSDKKKYNQLYMEKYRRKKVKKTVKNV